jgi:hypothetical protein
MTDKNDKLFLGANKISSDLKAIDYDNSSYRIKNLDISESYTFFQHDSASNTFFSIFKIKKEPVTSTDSENQPITATVSESPADASSDINYTIENLALIMVF